MWRIIARARVEPILFDEVCVADNIIDEALGNFMIEGLVKNGLKIDMTYHLVTPKYVLRTKMRRKW